MAESLKTDNIPCMPGMNIGACLEELLSALQADECPKKFPYIVTPENSYIRRSLGSSELVVIPQIDIDACLEKLLALLKEKGDLVLPILPASNLIKNYDELPHHPLSHYVDLANHDEPHHHSPPCYHELEY